MPSSGNCWWKQRETKERGGGRRQERRRMRVLLGLGRVRSIAREIYMVWIDPEHTRHKTCSHSSHDIVCLSSITVINVDLVAVIYPQHSPYHLQNWIKTVGVVCGVGGPERVSTNRNSCIAHFQIRHTFLILVVNTENITWANQIFSVSKKKDWTSQPPVSSPSSSSVPVLLSRLQSLFRSVWVVNQRQFCLFSSWKIDLDTAKNHVQSAGIPSILFRFFVNVHSC